KPLRDLPMPVILMDDVRNIASFVYYNATAINQNLVFQPQGENRTVVVFIKPDFRQQAVMYQVIMYSLISAPAHTRSLREEVYHFRQIVNNQMCSTYCETHTDNCIVVKPLKC